MRTVTIDASTPLLLSFAIVAAPVPWEHSRIEFSAVTECSEGFRLCFSEPEDVRAFAVAVRRFAAGCSDLERLHLDLYSPSHRPVSGRTKAPGHRPVLLHR